MISRQGHLQVLVVAISNAALSRDTGWCTLVSLFQRQASQILGFWDSTTIFQSWAKKLALPLVEIELDGFRVWAVLRRGLSSGPSEWVSDCVIMDTMRYSAMQLCNTVLGNSFFWEFETKYVDRGKSMSPGLQLQVLAIPWWDTEICFDKSNLAYIRLNLGGEVAKAPCYSKWRIETGHWRPESIWW